MRKLQFECELYEITAPDSLNYIIDDLKKLFSKKIEEYNKLFNINKYRKIKLNLFDEQSKLKKFIKQSFGDNIPEFVSGTYHGGMINCYIEKELEFKSDRYYGNIHLPCHELFHLMYNELILKNDVSKRIVWYDEGLAQVMSGELDFLDEDRFKRIYFDVKENTKELPNLNKINHDNNNFITNLYNGYDLSYLAVRYLKETLEEEKFYKLLNDFNWIKQLGETIVSDMFEYYDYKYKTKLK